MPFGLRRGLTLVGLAFIVSIGCGPRFGLPTLCDPRPESQKLAEARKFDPYPDPTIAGDMRGARPREFMDPRPDPDLLAKQQMMIPNTSVAVPVGSLPAPPGVYIPPTYTSPPGTVIYPAAAPEMAPPMTSATPAGYPATGVSYVPGGTAYSPAATSYGGTMTTTGSANTAPVAYGKALGSP